MPIEIDWCGSVCSDTGSDWETIDLFYLALLILLLVLNNIDTTGVFLKRKNIVLKIDWPQLY